MISPAWKTTFTLVFLFATAFLAARSGALVTLQATSTQIGWLELFFLLGLFTIMRILQAWSLVRAMGLAGASLRFGESLDLAGLKGLYNLGLGGAGLVAQAIHARSRNLFSIRQLAFATVSQSLLLVSALGTLLVMFSTTLLQYTTAFLLLVSFGALTALIPFVVLRVPHHLGTLPTLFTKALGLSIENLRKKLSVLSYKRLLELWLIQITLISLRLVRIIAIALLIDPSTSVGQLAAATLLADLVTVVPLTPGGIGIRELLIGLGASLEGQSEIFIAAAIIDRGITVAGNLFHGTCTIVLNFRKQSA